MAPNLDRTLIIFVNDKHGKPVNGADIRFFVNGTFIGETASARGRGSLQTAHANAAIRVEVRFAGITESATLSASQDCYTFKLDVVVSAPAFQTYLPLAVGLALLGTSVALAFSFGTPTTLQQRIILILASLGGGGIASAIPGFINAKITIGTQLVVGAAGAMAVFVLLYFFAPG